MIYLYCYSSVMHHYSPTTTIRLITTTKKIIYILLIYLFLFPSIYNVVVDAVIPEDDPILQLLGLPRYNHCSFALNNSLFIFGGNQEQQASSTTTTLESIQLNFTTIDTPPAMDVLLNDNQTASTALLNNITLGAGCAITSYGHALFLPPHGILSTYNLLTRQWILPDNVQGSPSALASFSNNSTNITSITPPLPEMTITAANNNTDRRRDLMVSAMWNDRWVIFGGRLAEDNNNFTQDTFILDARMTTPWVWFESPMTVNTPPAPTLTSRGTMVATSRWILYFAITANSTTTTTTAPNTTPFDNIDNRPYNVAVYCFDPIVLLWIGQIANFTSSAKQLEAASFGSDSVLIVPAAASSSSNTLTTTATTMATTMTSAPNSNSNSSKNSKLGQQQRIVLPPQGLWRLDMSPDIAAGTIHWINNAGPFRPLIGGTMTRLTNDLILFYGGIPFSHDSLRFWNTTSGLFIDPGWWRNIQWNPRPTFRPTNNNEQQEEEEGLNILAIILGTVLGSLGFIILIITIYYFCCYRKRQRNKSSRSRSTNTSPTGRQRSVTPISIRTSFSSFLWPNNNNVTIAGRPYSPHNNNNNNNNINNEEIMNDSEDAKTWATQLRRTLSVVAHKNRWSRSSPQPQSSAALHYHQDITQVSPGSDRPMISSPIAEGSETPTNYHYGNTHSQNNRQLDLSIGVIDTERQRRIRESSRFNEHFDLLAPPEYM
ncbi:hypothetical protein BDC45DRAFT_519101 [Circinella umbellata]|nr:hypothetical protein BDC45DRAFT_519101 [Circinella umbellata]